MLPRHWVLIAITLAVGYFLGKSYPSLVPVSLPLPGGQ